MPKQVQKRAREAVESEAERLAERMKTIVPVDQGDLKDSITVTRGGGRTPSYSHPGGSHVVPVGAAEVTAGNNKVRYAHIIEYGKKDTPADPFFWPVVRTERRKVRTRISKAVRQGLIEAKA